ncbi:cupin domain-containing protein [Rathayibacter tritici]|uniref:cupin domain-containing protein n=1 Tax=Rathayibacter tritici TaxID=33888 RepID=UPI001475AD75|nr:cupin domain-containing protein [Rathayibacter tritici]
MTKVDFEDLAGNTATFLDEYRDKKPLLRVGAIAAPHELLTLGEIDDLLTSEAIRPPYFRMAKGGDQIRDGVFTQLTRVQLSHMDDVVDPVKVIQAFQGGATITWNSMNHFNANLRQIATTLSRTLGCRSDVVSFLTPGGRVQGFAPHLDSTEVFVIQLYGQKKWSVWETIIPRPSAGYALDPQTLGEPTMEFVMNPGDVLYLPWGTPHVASSVDQMSFHLSVTTKPRSLSELLQDIVKDVTEGDESFSEQPTLNESRAHDVTEVLSRAVQRLVLKLDSLDLSTMSKRAIVTASNQIGTGHINFFEAMAESEASLGELTSLVRAEGQAALVIEDARDGKVDVKVGLRTFRMDDRAIPALQILQRDPVITVAELSAHAGDSAAVALVQTLLRVGYLKSVRP